MAFKIQKAVREKIYVKIALIAPSGGGKTYGSLRLATGMAEEIEKMTGTKGKILMGNTESSRGKYYANEFDYDIVDIESPHNPEKYVEFINFAVSEGYDILILDSTSHEWEGKGGCLELHQQAGGTYQAWGKITPRHNKFLEALAESRIHIIATSRGKDQYELSKDERGKTNVQKLAVGAQQRSGWEYEFSVSFLIDQKTSMSEAQKDNTHIFDVESAVLLSEEHGKKIIQWANTSDIEPTTKAPNSSSLLSQLHDLIIQAAKEKKSTGYTQDDIGNVIAEISGKKNPNAIKDIEIAQKVLDAVLAM